MRLIATLLLLMAVASPLAQQAPATGLILGRVVEATTGAPVAGATVMLGEDSREGRPVGVLTDADGHFVFTGVRAGSLRLLAQKAGYEIASFGQRRPGGDGSLLVLGDAARRGDIVLRMWKHSAITGTVTDESGDPAAGVPISAVSRTFVAGRPTLGETFTMTLTDDRGVFRLGRLPPGEYVVGLLRRDRTAPAAIVDQVHALTLAGQRDDARALVSALYSAHAGMAPAGSRDTLRVEAALFGLSPPTVVPGPEGWLMYPTQFHPAATSAADARPIRVTSGDEIAGVDLRLRRTRAFVVSGTLQDARGPVAQFPVRLVPADVDEFQREMTAPGHATVTDAAGRFVFAAVSPGRYVVRALRGAGGGVEWAAASFGGGEDSVIVSAGDWAMVAAEMPPARPAEPTRYASTQVVVAERHVALEPIVLATGAALSGTVEFIGRTAKAEAAALKQIGIVVEAATGRSAGMDFEMTGRADAEGRFKTVELPPGRYFVRVPRTPPGWMLESVMSGGRDVSDEPLDVGDAPVAGLTIRLTQKPATLSGVVSAPARAGGGAAGAAEPSANDLGRALVVVFPADRSRWRDYGENPRALRSAGARSDGAYEVSGLPPGDYFVAAIADDFLRDWRAPATLEAIAQSATRVTLARGASVTQSLTLTPFPAVSR